LSTTDGGGAVFSQAAHQVDIVRMLAGRPCHSTARRGRKVGFNASDRGRILRATLVR
jgi:predicted dehydrogenase